MVIAGPAEIGFFHSCHSDIGCWQDRYFRCCSVNLPHTNGNKYKNDGMCECSDAPGHQDFFGSALEGLQGRGEWVGGVQHIPQDVEGRPVGAV